MDRLDEIEQRLANATPGPWEMGAVEPMPDGWPGAYAAVEPNIAGGLDPLDADLIAHAPTDLAALVTVVREVAALHRPSSGYDGISGEEYETCAHCMETYNEPTETPWDYRWPCPTAAAVQKLGEAS